MGKYRNLVQPDEELAPYGTIVFRSYQYPVATKSGKTMIFRAYKMARKNGLSRNMAENVVMLPIIAASPYQIDRDGML